MTTQHSSSWNCKPTKAAFSAIAALLLLGSAVQVEAAATGQIRIEYVKPKEAIHERLADVLKERRLLERLQEFLAPLRLPRPLLLKTEGCDGDSNAWFEGDAVTVCYEYLYDVVAAARKRTRPGGLTEQDAIVGGFFDVFLHEVGHALFNYLDMPILGREEDAADQVAAYVMLNLGKEEARRLISGAIYFYAAEIGATTAWRLRRKRIRSRASDYADVHGTPAQRLYNVMCIAYGADPKLFAKIVESKALPQERAEGCAEEYDQIAKAFERLIAPHIDPVLAKGVMQRQWLPRPKK
jgi:hypothetical protein